MVSWELSAILRQHCSSSMNAGPTSSVLRTSVQPFLSFLRAPVRPLAVATLPSFQPPTFVRFLAFLYWLLSLLYFSHFAVTYFAYFAVTFFFFINSCAFSYCLSFLLPDEASGRNVVNWTFCCSIVSCSLNYYTSILFVLHKCRKFLSVAHFGAAIHVFSARLCAASCVCNFAFCSTTYVRLLSHLSTLAFVTFVFFTLPCHLFFILRCHPFFLHKLMRFLILSFIFLT